MAAVIVVTELGSDFQKDTIVAGADLKTFSFFFFFFFKRHYSREAGAHGKLEEVVEVGTDIGG